MAATAKKATEKISAPDECRSTIFLPDCDAEIVQFTAYSHVYSDITPSYEELQNWYEAEIGLPYCYDKIAELAFYKAKSRGFEPGYELDDWLEAEREFLL